MYGMLNFEIMAEDLVIKGGSKEERYACLLPQMAAVLEGETDEIARMANVAAGIVEEDNADEFMMMTGIDDYDILTYEDSVYGDLSADDQVP